MERLTQTHHLLAQDQKVMYNYEMDERTHRAEELAWIQMSVLIVIRDIMLMVHIVEVVLSCLMPGNIRIYHDCGLAKSFTRITVWHHEACRVMTYCDRENVFVYPILTRKMNSVSCSPSNTRFLYFFTLLRAVSEYTEIRQGIMKSIYITMTSFVFQRGPVRF